MLPPATLMLSAFLFLNDWKERRFDGSNSRDLLILGLLLICASQAFLISFPRTDEAHIQINSTHLFILVAFLLWRLYRGWASLLPTTGKVRGAVMAATCVVVLAIPFLWSMKIFHFFTPGIPDDFLKRNPNNPLVSGIEAGLIDSYPEARFDFPRSQGLSIPIWHTPPVHPIVMKDLPEVIHFLRENTRSDEQIFVMCGLQIIYFLAQRESIIQKGNYFTFLAAWKLVDSTERLRLSDEQLFERLVLASPPFIIQAGMGGHTENMAAIYPKSAGFIANNYEVSRAFGAYIVLKPRFAPKEESRN
jgi:hypothetical protein